MKEYWGISCRSSDSNYFLHMFMFFQICFRMSSISRSEIRENKSELLRLLLSLRVFLGLQNEVSPKSKLRSDSFFLTLSRSKNCVRSWAFLSSWFTLIFALRKSIGLFILCWLGDIKVYFCIIAASLDLSIQVGDTETGLWSIFTGFQSIIMFCLAGL